MKKLIILILICINTTIHANELKFSNGHGFHIIENFDGQSLDFSISKSFNDPRLFFSLKFNNSWLYDDHEGLFDANEDEEILEDKLTVSSFGFGIRRYLFDKKSGFKPYIGFNAMGSYVQAKEWLSTDTYQEESSFGVNVNTSLVLNWEGRRVQFSPGISLGYYHSKFFEDNIDSASIKFFFTFGFKI